MAGPRTPWLVKRSFGLPVEFGKETDTTLRVPVELKMDFEWDEAKRLSNLEDHKVDFRDAVQIFERELLSLPRKTRERIMASSDFSL